MKKYPVSFEKASQNKKKTLKQIFYFFLFCFFIFLHTSFTFLNKLNRIRLREFEHKNVFYFMNQHFISFVFLNTFLISFLPNFFIYFGIIENS